VGGDGDGDGDGDEAVIEFIIFARTSTWGDSRAQAQVCASAHGHVAVAVAVIDHDAVNVRYLSHLQAQATSTIAR
jgi:hypothetical protein